VHISATILFHDWERKGGSKKRVGRRGGIRRRRGGRECNSSVPYISLPGDTSIS